MRRCPACHLRMLHTEPEGRTVCLSCGTAAHEPEESMLTKLLSNMTPEADPDSGPRELPDLAAIKSRVMARIGASEPVS